jgi:hypothetical protein
MAVPDGATVTGRLAKRASACAAPGVSAMAARAAMPARASRPVSSASRAGSPAAGSCPEQPGGAKIGERAEMAQAPDGEAFQRGLVGGLIGLLDAQIGQHRLGVRHRHAGAYAQGGGPRVGCHHQPARALARGGQQRPVRRARGA